MGNVCNCMRYSCRITSHTHLYQTNSIMAFHTELLTNSFIYVQDWHLSEQWPSRKLQRAQHVLPFYSRCHAPNRSRTHKINKPNYKYTNPLITGSQWHLHRWVLHFWEVQWPETIFMTCFLSYKEFWALFMCLSNIVSLLSPQIDYSCIHILMFQKIYYK